MRVSKDLSIIDKINKDTQVSKFVFENDFIPLTGTCKYDNYIVFDNGTGYCWLIDNRDGSWLAHIAAIRSGRAKFHTFTEKVIKYMFEKTTCLSIEAEIPIRYLHSKLLVRKLGFKKTKELKDGYLGKKEVWKKEI